MPLDERLRAALHDNATTFTPDTEAAWNQIHRSRHRIAIGRALAATAVTAAVVVGLAFIVQPDHDASTPVTEPPSQTAAHLSGRYRATLSASTGDADRYDLTGAWEVSFDPTGILDIRPPSTFTGLIDTQLYETSGNQFRTDLFRTDLCSGRTDVATYEWRTDAEGVLRFTTVDDDCAPRTTLWTTAEWKPVP